MAKQLTVQVKLQCPGGQATPAPPVGPALGAHGVNIGLFVKQFNDKTKDMAGVKIPEGLTAFSDRRFRFITQTPPSRDPLQQAAPIPVEKEKNSESIYGSQK